MLKILKIIAALVAIVILIAWILVVRAFYFNPYVEIEFKKYSKNNIVEIIVKHGSEVVRRDVNNKESTVIKYHALHGSSDPVVITVVFENGEQLSENYSAGFANGEELTINVFPERLSLIRRRATFF
jgi:hypothetical protein